MATSRVRLGPASPSVPASAKDASSEGKSSGNQGRTSAKYYQQRMVFNIPKEYTDVTKTFLHSEKKLGALLNVIFSPDNVKDSPETRAQFQREWERYNETQKIYNRIYKSHEQKGSQRMWEALSALPAEMFAYAIRSPSHRFPENLRFSRMHRSAIMKSLSGVEMRRLQVYSNIMHVRLPHAGKYHGEGKRRFWVPIETMAARYKELALAKVALATGASGKDTSRKK